VPRGKSNFAVIFRAAPCVNAPLRINLTTVTWNNTFTSQCWLVSDIAIFLLKGDVKLELTNSQCWQTHVQGSKKTFHHIRCLFTTIISWWKCIKWAILVTVHSWMSWNGMNTPALVITLQASRIISLPWLSSTEDEYRYFHRVHPSCCTTSSLTVYSPQSSLFVCRSPTME